MTTAQTIKRLSRLGALEPPEAIMAYVGSQIVESTTGKHLESTTAIAEALGLGYIQTKQTLRDLVVAGRLVRTGKTAWTLPGLQADGWLSQLTMASTKDCQVDEANHKDTMVDTGVF